MLLSNTFLKFQFFMSYLWRRQICHRISRRRHRCEEVDLSRTDRSAWDNPPALCCSSDAKTTDPAVQKDAKRTITITLMLQQLPMLHLVMCALKDFLKFYNDSVCFAESGNYHNKYWKISYYLVQRSAKSSCVLTSASSICKTVWAKQKCSFSNRSSSAAGIPHTCIH